MDGAPGDIGIPVSDLRNHYRYSELNDLRVRVHRRKLYSLKNPSVAN